MMIVNWRQEQASSVAPRFSNGPDCGSSLTGKNFLGTLQTKAKLLMSSKNPPTLD